MKAEAFTAISPASDGILVLFSRNRRRFLDQWSIHVQNWQNFYVFPLVSQISALPPGKHEKITKSDFF